jgi:hypothetical protein
MQQKTDAIPKPERDAPNSAYAIWKNSLLSNEYLLNEKPETLKERLLTACAFNSNSIKAAIEANAFNLCNSKDNAHITSLDQLNLPYAEYIYLKSIKGIDSIQRLKDLEAIQDIIEDFDPSQVSMPKVYIDGNGEYIIVDGEHTAMVLDTIASQLQDDNAKIWVQVIPFKADRMRDLFLEINSNSTPVDKFDDFRLQVYEYLENPVGASKKAKKAWEIQKLLTKYNLFFTWEHTVDKTEPGALPRQLEFIGAGSHSIKGLELFCRFLHVNKINQTRCITSSEQDLLTDFFDDARHANVKYSDEDLMQMYTWMNNRFEADVSYPEGTDATIDWNIQSPFVTAVRESYYTWALNHGVASLGKIVKVGFKAKHDAVGAEFLRCCLKHLGFRVGTGEYLHDKRMTYTPTIEEITAFLDVNSMEA